ncbi:aminodeoxychorismate synthase component I [Sphingosinithalassobacter tenebrarum]|uniref:Probable branched-chain-amino-acid aminotransferase n=2 Tax=Stakelama tenebrarum TaxID=2711215 RepID=A0A6G6YA68_9SPHN|nr:aminodeoxychorismate synthase component I [Sphingosinithalassobacter tenebrarum]QIG81707.1 aminodeoxychorismate synthase component I [Sphingosinithalassobacter tenebrarum]
MTLPDPPFVLLDDARPGGAGTRLYHELRSVIRADTPGEVAGALQGLASLQDSGEQLAGYIAYEAASGIEAHARTHRGGAPLLWFGRFDRRDFVDPDMLLPDPAGAWAGAPEPRIDRQSYGERFARVAEYIRAGDIYQANLSFRAELPFVGHPAALYALLRARAGAGYGALIATGERWFLSLSPELFVATGESGYVTRPMKGTAPRGATPGEDDAIAAALAADPKQRAENLMIVDLMRNDLSRVAAPGSVRVPQLFHVERYPTVHQMVSTVTARPAKGNGIVEALAALFPCGSITGAPKLRAMEVIAETESDARGIYTGTIGAIDSDGSAVFNVAIRTLTIENGANRAVLGLGSGLVADSSVDAEWEECLAKGAFVTAGETSFDLIETMAFDPIAGIPLLERHLARMKASALELGFSFDRHTTRNELQAATFRLRAPSRIRLVLARSGAIAIGIAPMPARPEGTVRTAFAALPVARDDFRLRHKTTRRGFYDAARRPGIFETLFTDADGWLTEGSITSIFVERGGRLITPPLSRGLLPGVLRDELIDTGRAVEGDLRPADLSGGFYIGNALRGLIPALPVADTIATPL